MWFSLTSSVVNILLLLIILLPHIFIDIIVPLPSAPIPSTSTSLDIVAAAFVTKMSCQWQPSTTASADSRIMLPLLLRLVPSPAVHYHCHHSRRRHHPLIGIADCYLSPSLSCHCLLCSHLSSMLCHPPMITPLLFLSWSSCPQYPPSYPHIH